MTIEEVAGFCGGRRVKSNPREGERAALGTTSSAFVEASLHQLIKAARLPNSGISEIAVNASLALIEGAKPQGEVEGALAIQMACTIAWRRSKAQNNFAGRSEQCRACLAVLGVEKRSMEADQTDHSPFDVRRPRAVVPLSLRKWCAVTSPTSIRRVDLLWTLAADLSMALAAVAVLAMILAMAVQS